MRRTLYEKVAHSHGGQVALLMPTAITFLILGQTAAARADEVTISGSATGNASGVPQLTFEGNPNFTAMTVLGVGVERLEQPRDVLPELPRRRWLAGRSP